MVPASVAIAIPALGVATAVLLRGVVDHHRAMISHRTATRVQEELRGRLYDKIAALGPAWFAGERTGGVMLSVVDGVEQLQTFFGQYIPQVCIAVLTPLAIFVFIAFWDVPVASGHAGLRAADPDRARRLRAPRAPLQPRAPADSQILRLGVSRRGPGPADIEGVRPERRLWQPPRRARAAAVRQFAAGAVDGRDDPRHHRLRRRDRRRRGPGSRGMAGLATG